MKTLCIQLALAAACALVPHLTLGQTTFEETLEDGDWDGSKEVQTDCSTCFSVVSPAFGARSGSRALRIEWKRSLAGSSRGSKSTEAKSATSPRIPWEQEFWVGFSVYLPDQDPNGMKVDGKNCMIFQVMGYSGCSPSNKTAALRLAGSGLDFAYVDKSETQRTFNITSNLTRNRWHDIVLHLRTDLNSNDSFAEVWLDGTKAATKYNFQMGHGGSCSGGTYLKYGTYQFNGSDYANRVLYFDEVRHQPGNVGYDAVAPGGGGSAPANQAPVASFTATPTSGAAPLAVSFDAAASSDPDGTISAYAWDFGDGSTGTGKTVSRTYAAAGTYSARLTVTDNQGATSSTSKTVTVTAPPTATAVWLEAESGTISAPMQVLSDAAASGGQYITVAAGNTSGSTPPTSGIARYNLSLAQAGTYKLWGRVIAPSTADDSFWVRVDGGSWIKWNYVEVGSAWHWDEVQNSDNGNQVLQLSLAAGAHTLEIGYRDDGALLDKLLLTSDLTYVPSGAGETAARLVSPTTQPHSQAEAVLVPNPAADHVQVQFVAPAAGPVWVQLVDRAGTVRLTQRFSARAGQNSLNVLLPSLPVGLLVVRVLTKDQLLTTRTLQVQP
ncbi:PKD domain-containing protein [Hymenobacter weizhouensis]|uniref:PKD domain-containing protein n=1 Tax=Hymenobacter sp. YIM 151500-1 TaxID=2987689 RepID=UPI0022261F3E|nr:PKD domain-containing protein [Hymenobacter sp. YIM 151500-1]UYZ64948.1 PKD domain-containing protein [Hymenobacter sp. YIM 151500-1]